MVHDTKPTHYEPPGFEPTPRGLQAGCMPTMILRRCAVLSQSAHWRGVWTSLNPYS